MVDPLFVTGNLVLTTELKTYQFSKLVTVKSLKADVSSVSPSYIALPKGWRSQRQPLNS